MKNRKYPLSVIGLVLAGVTWIAGADGKENTDLKTQERAIRAAAAEYVAAVRRGDRDSLKQMWTADGDYVDASGRVFKTQDLIGEQVGSTQSDSESKEPRTPNSSVRLITADVAIEDGAYDCGLSGNGNTLSGRFTAVWVKRDGRWLMDSLREAACESPPTFNEKLMPLEWLLGEWIGTTDDAVVLVSSHWNDDGKYIVREFLIRGDGREDISATQRIGWDSSARQIRCWTFDSQGGMGEGVWKADGKRWLVDTTELLADGKKSKTSAVYMPGDGGQFASEVRSSWNAENGKEAGANLPALRIEFKRAPEDN